MATIYTSGSDTTGTALDDFIYGYNFNDTIDGGDGDDFLWIKGYLNTLIGGAGSDTIISFGSYNDLYGDYETVTLEVIDTELDANADPLPGEVNGEPVDDIPVNFAGDKLISIGSHNDLTGDVGSYSVHVVDSILTGLNINFGRLPGSTDIHNVLIAAGHANTLVGNVGEFLLDVQVNGDTTADISNATIRFGNDFLKALGDHNVLIGDVQTSDWSVTIDNLAVGSFSLTVLTDEDTDVLKVDEDATAVVISTVAPAKINFAGINFDTTAIYGDDILKSYGKHTVLIGDVQNSTWTPALDDISLSFVVQNIVNGSATATSTNGNAMANVRVASTANAEMVGINFDATATYGHDKLISHGANTLLIGDVQTSDWALTLTDIAGSFKDAAITIANATATSTNGNAVANAIAVANATAEMVGINFDATATYGNDKLISYGTNTLLIGDVQTSSWTLALANISDSFRVEAIAGKFDTTVAGAQATATSTNGDDDAEAFATANAKAEIVGINFDATATYGNDKLISHGANTLLIGDVQTSDWTLTVDNITDSFRVDTSAFASATATDIADAEATTSLKAVLFGIKLEATVTYGDDILTNYGADTVLIGDVQHSSWSLAASNIEDSFTTLATADASATALQASTMAAASTVTEIASIYFDANITYGDDTLTVIQHHDYYHSYWDANDNILIGDVAFMEMTLTDDGLDALQQPVITNTTLTLGDDTLVSGKGDEHMWGDIGALHGEITHGMSTTSYGNWDGTPLTVEDLLDTNTIPPFEGSALEDFLADAGTGNMLTGGNDIFSFDVSHYFGDDIIYDFDEIGMDTLQFTGVLDDDSDTLGELTDLEAMLDFAFGDDGNGNLQVTVNEDGTSNEVGTITFANMAAPVGPMNLTDITNNVDVVLA